MYSKFGKAKGKTKEIATWVLPRAREGVTRIHQQDHAKVVLLSGNRGKDEQDTTKHPLFSKDRTRSGLGWKG